jgi:hypothetical protein
MDATTADYDESRSQAFNSPKRKESPRKGIRNLGSKSQEIRKVQQRGMLKMSEKIESLRDKIDDK